METVLGRLHHRTLSVGGCGRTDAGVHASQYYLHLRTAAPLPDRYRFIVNKQLPPGILLLEVVPVGPKAQARYDATARTYDYFFHDFPDVWLQRFSSRIDLSRFHASPALAEALTLLHGLHDFRAFCKTPDRHNTTLVNMQAVTLFRNAAGDRFRLRFVANRFLRGMIRLLVNDLLLVGNGQLSVTDFRNMLVHGERQPHFRLAPPEGLFLSGVAYPFITRPPDLPPSGESVCLRLYPER